MPRQSQKRLKGQKRVHEQDSFDFTAPRLRPAARPVDAYVANPVDNSADNIKKFVNQMEDIGNKSGSLAQYKQAQERKAGQTAAMRGEDPAEDAHWAFIEGHEKFSGEAANLEYRKDLEELYSTGWQMAPDEWRDKKEEINQKYLKGATDAYIQGFVPGAVDIEAQYDDKYQKAQKTLVIDDFKTNVRRAAREKMHRVGNDPKLSGMDGAKQMRSTLSAMQEGGKKYGLSRAEVSEQFVKSIGEEAVRSGRPDLMTFAIVPDKSGHKLIDRPEVADKVNQYINAAMSERESLDNKVLKEEEKLEKERNESIDRALVVSIESGDFTDAKNLIRQYADKLSPERLEKHVRRIKKLESEEGWVEISNPKDYQNYFNRAVTGEMDATDWELAGYQLTMAEYKEIAKVNARAVESSQSGAAPSRVTLNEYKRILMDNVKASKGITGVFLDPDGDKRQGYATHQFNLKFEGYLRENSKAPTVEVLDKWMKEIEVDTLGRWPITDPTTRQGNRTSTSTNSNGATVVKGKMPESDVTEDNIDDQTLENRLNSLNK
jgi:hypothetical protein